jgi:tetratricopeptide (TPR) repeat protein
MQRSIQSARPRVVQILLFAAFCFTLVPCGARAQSSDGRDEGAFRGFHAELEVVLRDSSGQALAVSAVVKLFRSGTPTGQVSTSNGRATFILPALGDYTVMVQAAGFKPQQRDVSVALEVKSEIDVEMSRDAASDMIVPGRPLLAPKAKEAFDKGLQALSQDKMKDAEKYVAEATKLAPGHPDVLYVQGVLYLKQRNWAEAQSALEKATQIDPTHARAFAALGMAYVDEGKYDAAIPPLEKSVQLEPGGWEVEFTLAKAYYHHQQYEEALKASQEALAASKGKAPEIELLVAQSLTAVGRYEESATTLRDFLKNHGSRPEAATAKKWLDRLTASGKIKQG